MKRREKKKSAVGWSENLDPSESTSTTNLPPTSASNSENTTGKQEKKKSSIGWNPERLEQQQESNTKDAVQEQDDKKGIQDSINVLPKMNTAELTNDTNTKDKTEMEKNQKVQNSIGWDESRLTTTSSGKSPKAGKSIAQDSVGSRKLFGETKKKSSSKSASAGLSQKDSLIDVLSKGNNDVSLTTKKVPYELHALLLFASQRGINLYLWFCPELDPEEGIEEQSSGKEDIKDLGAIKANGSIICNRKAFTERLEGLAAALSKVLGVDKNPEVKHVVDKAVAAQCIDNCMLAFYTKFDGKDEYLNVTGLLNACDIYESSKLVSEEIVIQENTEQEKDEIIMTNDIQESHTVNNLQGIEETSAKAESLSKTIKKNKKGKIHSRMGNNTTKNGSKVSIRVKYTSREGDYES